jgi:hypothetical protein
MTVDRIVHVFAGAMVLLSLLLARTVSPWFLALTAFVGLNLLQSGITQWCLLATILRRMGVPETPPTAAAPARAASRQAG